MTDLERWELRGPVRTLRKHFAEWNPEIGDWSAPKGRSLVAFRPDGMVGETEHYNPDGSVARHLRVYDDGGRLTEGQSWSNDVLTNRVLHSYNVFGRPASLKRIDADGTERETEVCRYDDEGRMTKVVVLPVAEGNAASCSTGACGGMLYGVEGSDSAYSAPGATSSTTAYDEHGRPSDVRFHDANQALVCQVMFSRDEYGRVLSERMEFTGPAGLLGTAFGNNVPADERASLMELLETAFDDGTFSLATYAYDEKGRRTETIRRMGKLSEERVSVRYDDFDNPIEEVRVDVNREVRVDDGAVKSEESPSQIQHVRFEYQYDSYGNWTERIVWSRMEPNTDERRSNVERRAVEYYTGMPPRATGENRAQ